MSIANGEIEVGDLVRIRFPAELRKSLGVSFMVEGVKRTGGNVRTPYWTLREVATNELIVIDSPVILEVTN